MSKPVAKSLRLEADLARAVDVARGDVSWSRWVTRAIEERLATGTESVPLEPVVTQAERLAVVRRGSVSPSLQRFKNS